MAQLGVGRQERKPGIHVRPQMQKCIDECLTCHSVCLSMASQHCLEKGGMHVEPEHFRLMMSCAEICRTAAAFMLIGSDLHRQTCTVCAEVCDKCAESCENVGEMDDCVQACRRCAQSCREMAAMH
jgi:hypothetical protein